MPENPALARERLVRHLRDTSGVNAADIAQAADEIESLAAQLDTRDSDAFRKTFAKFADTAQAVSDMANDGFKAPEQTMEMLPALFNDAWHLQIAWELVRRGR